MNSFGLLIQTRKSTQEKNPSRVFCSIFSSALFLLSPLFLPFLSGCGEVDEGVIVEKRHEAAREVVRKRKKTEKGKDVVVPFYYLDDEDWVLEVERYAKGKEIGKETVSFYVEKETFDRFKGGEHFMNDGGARDKDAWKEQEITWEKVEELRKAGHKLEVLDDD
jgi:hypothetical protein